MKEKIPAFLPVCKEDLIDRGWYWYDFLLISGDAYVDHPSFGTVIIARVLEDAGYRVALLAQPDWRTTEAFTALGKPRLGVMISGGNIDPMVAHYTAAKKRRSEDLYSPGRKMGLRPDRATIVYSNKVREAFGDIPIVIGGLEASLRRYAHYDYWDDRVRRSILLDAQADLLVYGMGEKATLEVAKQLSKKVPIHQITNVRGTSFLSRDKSVCSYPAVEVASYEEVCASKKAYAQANMVEYEEHDPVRGKAIIQPHGEAYLITNPPQMPLSTRELDHVAELPYMRAWHPMYDAQGGIAAIEEVKFSIAHNRGCIGACNFCALAFHQGRMITARSQESVLKEAELLTKLPDFKGYIHDVGGPTANFRHPSCEKQLKCGLCKNRNCLTPTPCPNVNPDHSDYLTLLRKMRAIPGIKKVFVRSGIRFDYMLLDKKGEFFSELVKYHISGQLKVAPEHCINSVLDYMGKPHNEVYEKFLDKYHALNDRYDKKQYLVPYLMSSHPGSTMEDAIALAEYLHAHHAHPEQVQDFYPTPGTLSTCMYYTGIDPRTMKPVYVPRDPHEKAMQRALLQWKNPKNRALVLEALRKSGRTDLIGYGPNCLIRPNDGPAPWERDKEGKGKKPANPPKKGGKVTYTEKSDTPRPKKKPKGWAKAKPKTNAKPRSKK